MASPVVRALAHAASLVFYRVDCVGAPPSKGAVLLLPNHPNSLLDPAVIWTTADRDVRFLAKSTLFSTPLRPLLAGAGAVPVYRRHDKGVDTSKNAETFTAVEGALAAGDAVCVFPEGVSHSTGRLVPLRTGAARMALGAERGGTPVAIVPVGLNFDRKTAFRSRVTVVYGRPFSCADLVSGTDDAAAVRMLTDRIAEHMRRLLIEADPEGDALLVERIDRLYAAARGRPADPADRVARRRAIAAGLDRLRTADAERYDQIFMKFRRYDERLRRIGLRDRHLDWAVSSGDAARFVMRELLAAIVVVPVAVAGLATFAVPYFVTHRIAHRVTREKDVVATAQLFAGAVVYTVWMALIALAAGTIAGPLAGVVTFLVLPVVAIVGLLAVERESSVVDTVKAWLLLRRTRRETRERLRRSRSELADLLDAVYEWLNADTRAPSGGQTPY
jgi:glycerol-3-phosphate O-acyltransferase/dihydroxyacetone phosphate acyltransferase